MNTSSFEDYQDYGAGGGVPPPQHPYAPQFDMTDPSFHNHSMAHHQQQQDMYQGTVFEFIACYLSIPASSFSTLWVRPANAMSKVDEIG
jgi:hypothetical protein